MAYSFSVALQNKNVSTETSDFLKQIINLKSFNPMHLRVIRNVNRVEPKLEKMDVLEKKIEVSLK